MFNFNRFPEQDLELGDSARSAFMPAELRLARLRITITLGQQRLKEVNRRILKTGLLTQEAAKLAQCMKTSVQLNRSTLQRIQESTNVLTRCHDLDTLRLIRKADHVLARFYRVDNLTKQAHTGLEGHT